MDWSISVGSYALPGALQIPSLSLPFHCFISPSVSPGPCPPPSCFLPTFLTELLLPLLWLFLRMAGFPRSTRPSYRSGVTAICGRWVRFPSIGVWTAWTRQGFWPRLNSARETRATWEPWAPSARLVAPRGPCLSAFGPYTPCTSTAMSNKVVQGGGHPTAAVFRCELTIRSPSGKIWKVPKPQSPN